MERIKRVIANRWLQLTGIIITAIIGAILGVSLLGPANYDMEGLTLKLALVPSAQGRTVIDIPPFGSLSAETHDAPFEIHVSLLRIGMDVVTDQQAIENAKKTFVDGLDKNARKLLVPFLIRQLVVGMLGALILVLLLWRPGWKRTMMGSLFGGLVLALTLTWGFSTYQANAFKAPDYDGVISLAPEMMKMGEQMLENLDELQSNTRTVFGNLRTLFDKVDALTFLGDPREERGIRRILIVSDLHSNPVGIEVVRSIVQNFDIDYLINGGDISDYGSSIEMKIAEELKTIQIPAVYAAGNHDTREVTSFMASLPNTQVLNGKTVLLGDLRVLGSSDSLADSTDVVNKEKESAEEQIKNQVNGLFDAAAIEGKPDIVVMHNPKYAKKLATLAPVVISGHTHKLSVKQVGGSILLNPGSTGAAGIRGGYSETDVPYSAMILYMQHGKLPLAVDIIVYHPASGRFSIERSLFEHTESFSSGSLPEENS